jgi:hypothetical protein
MLFCKPSISHVSTLICLPHSETTCGSNLWAFEGFGNQFCMFLGVSALIPRQTSHFSFLLVWEVSYLRSVLLLSLGCCSSSPILSRLGTFWRFPFQFLYHRFNEILGNNEGKAGVLLYHIYLYGSPTFLPYNINIKGHCFQRTYLMEPLYSEKSRRKLWYY